MDEAHPAIEPHDSGLLDVGDGNRLHWTVSGNPAGKPAVVVHGGPGSGSHPDNRRMFDPDRYRIIEFDQRGCGGSTPHAADPATDVRHTTKWHLVADLERWERLAANSGVPADADIVAAYARLLADPDQAVREKACEDWCAWEDAVLSGETSGKPYGDRPGPAKLAMVRICSRYFANGAWLEEGALIRDAHRLAGIPGVLIHGRADMGSPPHTAWAVHRDWPGSELIIVEDAGHLGNQVTRGH